MTGTAATQADEFRLVYGLEVEVIPTNRPMIRVDHPDVLFATEIGQGAGCDRRDPRASLRAAGRSWWEREASKSPNV